jgi:hypothetical protein
VNGALIRSAPSLLCSRPFFFSFCILHCRLSLSIADYRSVSLMLFFRYFCYTLSFGDFSVVHGLPQPRRVPLPSLLPEKPRRCLFKGPFCFNSPLLSTQRRRLQTDRNKYIDVLEGQKNGGTAYVTTFNELFDDAADTGCRTQAYTPPQDVSITCTEARVNEHVPRRLSSFFFLLRLDVLGSNQPAPSSLAFPFPYPQTSTDRQRSLHRNAIHSTSSRAPSTGNSFAFIYAQRQFRHKVPRVRYRRPLSGQPTHQRHLAAATATQHSDRTTGCRHRRGGRPRRTATNATWPPRPQPSTAIAQPGVGTDVGVGLGGRPPTPPGRRDRNIKPGFF